ncbi:relaxase/mobilization nuclease domain-containing protein [Neisseriaceae bacterium CLB008]
MDALSKNIDHWFLGYQTRAVGKKADGLPLSGKGNRGSRGGKPLKPNSGLTNLRAAAQKHPEVMVKIPKRKGASNGMNGVRGHLSYISRNGKLALETQDGEVINGKKAIEAITKEWQRLNIPDESKYREALNVVLSMPPGTNPEAVKNAAREFAKEQFDGHQYMFVQHLDEKHPHVHVCVLMRDEFGQRMNPRKNDLFEWRVRFAEKLRDEGVLCAATKRVHRGKTQKGEPGIQRQIRGRGEVGIVARQEARELIEALKNNTEPKHPFINNALQTRGIIVSEYGKIAKELYKLGHKTEARIISNLAKETTQAGFKTKAQDQFEAAQQHLTQSQSQGQDIGPDSIWER